MKIIQNIGKKRQFKHYSNTATAVFSFGTVLAMQITVLIIKKRTVSYGTGH